MIGRSWRRVPPGESLVFGLAFALCVVWVVTHRDETCGERLRHLYAVNVMAAPLWDAVSRSTGRRWIVLRRGPRPETPSPATPSATRHLAWTAGLWMATSLAGLGGDGVAAHAGTWVVLLCSLLVLEGLPPALEPRVGYPGAPLLVLALGGLTAAAGLALSALEPPPWPVRLWRETPVKIGVAAGLLLVYAGGFWLAHRREGGDHPGPPTGGAS